MEGMKNEELYDIINSHHKMDIKRLKLGEFDADPWNDAVKDHISKDGRLVGNNLCVRAWIRCAVGYVETSYPNAYNTLRFLAWAPAGVEYRDYVNSVNAHSAVLEILFQKYKLVEVVDASGELIEGIKTTKQFYACKGGGGLIRMRPTVAKMVLEMKEEFPDDSRRMLRLYMNTLDKQAEIIHSTLVADQTPAALQSLGVVEHTLWSCINYDALIRPGICGEDLTMIETAGRLGHSVALIMMSLNRLPEAIDATISCARFFAYLFESELTPTEIRSRKLNEAIRVKGPGQLGKVLRLSGEIKLTMAAHESAAQDLAAALVLESPIKFPVLSLVYTGSRIGQVKILISLLATQFTIDSDLTADF